MKKNKLLLVFLLILLISCTKKSTVADIFITPKNHYWQWSNTLQYSVGCGEINYTFEEDGYSHRYDFTTKEGYTLLEGQAGDVEILPAKWTVKNDSTLIWGPLTYKIEHIDHTVIVLAYTLPNDKKQYWTRLLKVVGEK